MKLRCFRSWILLPSSGEKREGRTEAYLLSSLAELNSVTQKCLVFPIQKKEKCRSGTIFLQRVSSKSSQN